MPRVKLFDEKEVLEKAMNLFWKKGYHATSVQDLVSCLGINRASLYDTFSDKEQLFKKSFELYRKSNIATLVSFFESRPNVKAGFSELFENAINEAMKDKDRKGCFAVNVTTELIPNDENLLAILAQNKQDFETIFYEYLKKGKENGQLTTTQDLQSIAALFYTLYNGIRVVSKICIDKKKHSNAIQVALSLLG